MIIKKINETRSRRCCLSRRQVDSHVDRNELDAILGDVHADLILSAGIDREEPLVLQCKVGYSDPALVGTLVEQFFSSRILDCADDKVDHVVRFHSTVHKRAPIDLSKLEYLAVNRVLQLIRANDNLIREGQCSLAVERISNLH